MDSLTSISLHQSTKNRLDEMRRKEDYKKSFENVIVELLRIKEQYQKITDVN